MTGVQGTTASDCSDDDDDDKRLNDHEQALDAPVLTMLPTASEDCDDDADDNDKQNEQALRARTTTTTTTKRAAALEDHRLLNEYRHLNDIVYLASQSR